LLAHAEVAIQGTRLGLLVGVIEGFCQVLDDYFCWRILAVKVIALNQVVGISTCSREHVVHLLLLVSVWIAVQFDLHISVPIFPCRVAIIQEDGRV
jgi:hypothetical protein